MIGISSLKSDYEGGASFILEALKKRNESLIDSIQSYKKGMYLYNEDAYPKGVFYILEGNVKLVRSADTGKERIVRLAGRNDIIGYRALLIGSSYKTSARALEKTEIVFLSSKLFHELICCPGINDQLIKLLANDMELSELKWINMSTRSLKSRIAELLISFKNKYGLLEDGKTLNIVLDREEFAEIVGVSVEAIIRRFNELKNEGIIETYGRNIQLLNIPALKLIVK